MRGDGLVNIEIWHGGKFNGNNSYIGGTAEIIDDCDYNYLEYDEFMGLVEDFGYTKIFKCGFRKVSTCESYCFFEDKNSWNDHIIQCVDLENGLLRLYVDAATLLPATYDINDGF